jgi:hypothetical protein
MARFNSRARRRLNRERQRRWYARRKRCEACYPVPVGVGVMTMLCHRGYLQDNETDDPREVIEAIRVLLLDCAEADAP